MSHDGQMSSNGSPLDDKNALQPPAKRVSLCFLRPRLPSPGWPQLKLILERAFPVTQHGLYKQGSRACVACRKGKNKCVNDGTAPCQRCKATNTQCVFEAPQSSKLAFDEERVERIEKSESFAVLLRPASWVPRS